jgi:hypothetical protein
MLTYDPVLGVFYQKSGEFDKIVKVADMAEKGREKSHLTHSDATAGVLGL